MIKVLHYDQRNPDSSHPTVQGVTLGQTLPLQCSLFYSHGYYSEKKNTLKEETQLYVH